MDNNKKKDYCIGLDIGTNSVGFAMTDMDGKLLKWKKRSTFGAVLFDSAHDASERRTNRSGRRRLDRKKQRIDLLQMLLEKDILTADPNFFHRLNESFLHEDDRKYPLLYGTMPKSIWVDGSESSIPSIYHLRYALTKENKKADIRYVYLALHHIIKYRGHFLLEGEELSDIGNDVQQTIADILVTLSEEPYSLDINTDIAIANEIKNILMIDYLSKTVKQEKILTCLAPDKDSKAAAKELAKLWVGLSGSLKTLLQYDGENPKEKLSLSEEFDEDAYIDALGNASDLFVSILSIYRWQVFANLRAPGETVSQTMRSLVKVTSGLPE